MSKIKKYKTNCGVKHFKSGKPIDTIHKWWSHTLGCKDCLSSEILFIFAKRKDNHISHHPHRITKANLHWDKIWMPKGSYIRHIDENLFSVNYRDEKELVQIILNPKSTYFVWEKEDTYIDDSFIADDENDGTYFGLLNEMNI